MSPWFETAGVALVAVLGIFLGRVFSGFQRPYWTFGYFLPCLAIALLILARFNDALYFVRPFCWVTTGRARFVILSFAVSTGLTVPLSRLPRKCEKILVCILMVVVVTWFCVLPFLVPALMRNRLSNLKTTVCSNGVCLQTTDYTCGPAAAVTALRQLGLPAEEGEIAVLSYSSPITGTLPTLLCSALRNRYGTAGLKCRYRRFDSIDQLKNEGITLVVVRRAFLLNHCLAVLDVSENIITVADPVTGTKLMSREQFEKIWRFSGIVLKRDSISSI
jgi:hypothetical protein